MAVKKGRKDNTPEAIILRRRRELRNRRILSSAIQKFIVLTAVLGILFGFIFGIAPMKGDDMKPQLSAGDLMIFYRLEKDLLRNDVIVMERDGSQYVGRLVGMPGDVLIIKNDGTINIGGNNIYETDIFYETHPYSDTVRYPVVLKKDEYFILADKRDTAKDSRYFGSVKRDEIKGKVLTVIRRISL